jgi:aspartate/methionine/tyrosine aminotransferase
MRKIQDTVVICPPVISQHVAVGALDPSVGGGAPYVREKLRAIAAVRTTVQSALAPLVAEGLCEIPPADGAFYFFLRVRSDLAPLALVERLVREHRVAVIPGSAFGLTQGCPLRVAYGALAPDTATEGIGRLVHGLRALVA